MKSTNSNPCKFPESKTPLNTLADCRNATTTKKLHSEHWSKNNTWSKRRHRLICWLIDPLLSPQRLLQWQQANKSNENEVLDG